MEFSLKNGINQVIATLVHDVGIDPRSWVLGVKQEGKSTFNQAAQIEHTETSVTFGFYGSSTYAPAIYDFHHGVQTYVTEVYARVNGMKVYLYAKSL